MKAIVTAGALALAAIGWAGQAAAEPVRFDAQGTITRSFGSLPASGSAEVGDAVSFSFVFDLDDAQLVGAFPSTNLYTLPFSDFSATVGDYAIMPFGTTAQLTVARGFTFFGGTSTEPSRSYSFIFFGAPGADAPFTGATGENFQVSATFRDPAGLDQPVTLADVTDPASADRSQFDYIGAISRSMPPSFGVLTGLYQGGFTSLAAVPEPATWTVMILGFGAVAGALRRRPAASRAIA